MILIIKMQQSYADDLERQNKQLRQQLKSLGINLYGAGTSIARPPDTYYHSDRTREWSGVLGLTFICRMIRPEDGALG